MSDVPLPPSGTKAAGRELPHALVRLVRLLGREVALEIRRKKSQTDPQASASDLCTDPRLYESAVDG